MSEGGNAAPMAAATDPACPWPSRYERRAKGLYRIEDDKDGNPVPIYVCGPIEVVALARTDSGGGWSQLLRFRDFDGREKTKLLPLSSLIGDALQPIRELIDEGLDVRKPHSLAQALALMRPSKRALALAMPGWSGPNFVFGTEVFGPPSPEDRIVINVRDVPPARGDLSQWRGSVAALASGNPRVMLAICAALAGPLLRPLGSAGFAIHFRGRSSTGKTTLLRVASSVTGQEIKTWRATDNALEGEAAEANDSLLILDELNEANAWHASASVFMLGNGTGKGRADKTGTRRLRAEFRTVVLSSGEISLAEKLAEPGRGLRPTAGQQVRLLDVPADAGKGWGVFEELHGFPTSAALAVSLGDATGSFSGAAMRSFLTELCADKQLHVETAAEARRAAVAQMISDGMNPEARRAADQFGLLASAGELATKLGITGWAIGAATAAAAQLFASWHAQHARGFVTEIDAVELVAGWIEAQITDGLSNIRGKTWQAEVRRVQCWCIGAEAWRNEVCAGKDPAAIARALSERGLLVHDEGRLQAKARPGQGLGSGEPINVYAVPTRILTQDR